MFLMFLIQEQGKFPLSLSLGDERRLQRADFRYAKGKYNSEENNLLMPFIRLQEICLGVL